MTMPSVGKFFPHLVYDRADGRVFAWGGPSKVVIVFDTREGFVDYALGRTSLYDHTIYTTESWPGANIMAQHPYHKVHDAFVELAESWVAPGDEANDDDDVETPGEWFNNARALVDRISLQWKLPRGDAGLVWHRLTNNGHNTRAQIAMDKDEWRALVATAIVDLDLTRNIGTLDYEPVKVDAVPAKPARKPTPIPEM